MLNLNAMIELRWLNCDDLTIPKNNRIVIGPMTHAKCHYT